MVGLLRSGGSYGFASAAAAAAGGAPKAGCCAAATAADGSQLRREVLEELQQQRQQLLQRRPLTGGFLLLQRTPSGSSWRSAAAAAAAAATRAQRWVEDRLGRLLTGRSVQQQQQLLQQQFEGLLTSLGLRSKSASASNSSSNSSSYWQLLWTSFVAAAAAATAAMAASSTVCPGADLSGGATAAAAGEAASRSNLKSWAVSSLLQCSGSALSFWGVCTAGTRMQQALGISCASVFSKPLGLLTIAVASNAAAAAAAAAGFACSRLQQLHAGRSGGPSAWLEAAKALQQETSGNLVAPGAFSERGLALSASTGYASDSERRLVKKIGLRFGCHSCGVRGRSTRWVADHQPPTAQVLSYERTALGRVLGAVRRMLGGSQYWPQRLYPHCEGCSLKQAVAVRRQTAAAAAAAAAAATAAAASQTLTAGAAAAKLRERKNLLQQQQLVYRWNSLRLWHFTGGILTLIRCIDAL
ncbi:hypothetical protein, conserved [Eimeria brunetti]|uniref:Uncharacterized protein n=1 Tax=Eimeria brunetti TaxID=51314 RepID=U6LNQ8_9EIME|nr:hypothetical protein, conserved [Eimeria brunetti]